MLGDRLYFAAEDKENGREPWTHELNVAVGGPGIRRTWMSANGCDLDFSSDPANFKQIASWPVHYISAETSACNSIALGYKAGARVQSLSGGVATTVQVSDVFELHAFDDKMFFTAGLNGRELYVGYENPASPQSLTYELAHTRMLGGRSWVGEVTSMRATTFRLLFTAGNSLGGTSLFSLERTATAADVSDAVELGQLSAVPGATIRDLLDLQDDSAVFVVDTAAENGEVWWVEGAGAPVQVDDPSGKGRGSFAFGTVLWQGLPHVVAADVAGAFAIYRVDAKSGAMVQVTRPSADMVPVKLVPTADRLYFNAQRAGFSGAWLFSLAPNTTGAEPVIEPTSKKQLLATDLATADGYVFFAGGMGNDEELWITDGTAAGTRLLQDVNVGPGSSFPRELRAVNGELFFTAYTPSTGRELFRVRARDIAGYYKPGHWPDGTWRPFSGASMFYQQVPANPTPVAGSAQMRDSLFLPWYGAKNIPNKIAMERDGHIGEPTYFSQLTDLPYTIHCTRCGNTVGVPNTGYAATPDGGGLQCPIEGRSIRVPAVAVPEQVGWRRQILPDGGRGPLIAPPEFSPSCGYDVPDYHMAIIDQENGLEYDLYQVQRLSPTGGPDGGGILVVNYGSAAPLSGNGLVTDAGPTGGATAAGFANTVGRIRAQEMMAGEIPHALFVVVPFTRAGGAAAGFFSDGRVLDLNTPGHAATANAVGYDGGQLPRMGDRLRCNFSWAFIDSLQLPRHETIILKALSKYGGIIHDTGSLGFEIEADSSQTQFLQPDGGRFPGPWWTYLGGLDAGVATYNPCTSGDNGLLAPGDCSSAQDQRVVSFNSAAWKSCIEFIP